MVRKTILMLDDIPSYLDSIAPHLEDEGYRVLKAPSLAEADRLLRENTVHLIVSDIRMEEDDADDMEGLNWVQRGTYQPIPKIMLTAYSKQYVHDVLQVVLDYKANIVDFVAKKDGPQALLVAVAKAFVKDVRCNWDLVLRWNPKYSVHHLLSLIEADLQPALLEERGKEFQDMLRKQFYDFVQVTFGRILTTTPGHVILEIFAYGESGKENPYILSCGRPQTIIDENERSKMVPGGQGKGGTSRADEIASVETLRFAASGYRLDAGDLSKMTSFSRFFRHNATAEIVKSLNHLYQTTLAPWHKDGLERKSYSLPDFVSALECDMDHPEQLEQRIDALFRQAEIAGVGHLERSGNQLLLQIAAQPTVSYPLPTHNLLTTLPKQQIVCGTIHGKINGHTVRLDREGSTWLIDFTQADEGELLRDFAGLETHIKFYWLRTVSIAERHLLEQHLIDTKRLGESIDTNGLPEEVAKALSIISHLRQIAAERLGPDLQSYRLGLCAYTLQYFCTFDTGIRYMARELERFVHALLSIAMLCDRLDPQTNPGQQLPPQAQRALWLDERNKCVWVKGQEINLAPQEYALLEYLYKNKNQLCTRDDIVRQLWGDEAEMVWSKSALDTLVGRVRDKIEVTRKKPQFLMTVRSRGYKLIV